jgi:hypothetical protein
VIAWKGILRQIKSYLSAGNVETPFDLWCADVGENGGNKVAEREALINLFGEEDASSVAGLKLLASNELLVVEYLEEKIRLGKSTRIVLSNEENSKEHKIRLLEAFLPDKTPWTL